MKKNDDEEEGYEHFKTLTQHRIGLLSTFTI